MFEIILNYSGFIVAIASLFTISVTIYAADKAKSYRLTLSELTIDRESRISLTIGMLIVGTFAWVTLNKALNEASANTPFLQALISICCGLYIATALALYFRWITLHYYCIGGYFLTAYLVQFVVGIVLHFDGGLSNPLHTLVLIIPFVSIVTFLALFLFNQKKWYWEISYAVFTCLFLLALNLTWL
jgi:hypothetical protein